MIPPDFVPYDDRYEPAASPEEAAEAFCDRMRRRRSVRAFSDRPVSRRTIEWLVRTAGSSPSGANTQPWRFVAVGEPAVKRQIRRAAEEAEHAFYEQGAGEAFLRDVKALGTSPDKRFLEVAPWLIAVFTLTAGDDGSAVYYPAASVGIAVGLLLAAAHHAGLATLPYTPSPPSFLASILKRPPHERPFMLIPVGYPAADCTVPAFARERKPLEDILVVHE
jgi:nitroreductase